MCKRESGVKVFIFVCILDLCAYLLYNILVTQTCNCSVVCTAYINLFKKLLYSLNVALLL